MQLRPSLYAFFLVIALSGCSGGSDESDSVASWTVDGRITDASGKGVEGATVTVPLNDRVYRETTGSNGDYKLKFPQSESFPRYFAGVIARDGFVPQTLNFQFSGGSLGVGQSSRALETATAADIIVPEGLAVIHLGDDGFSGAANSQLQVPSQGLAFFARFNLSESQKSTYPQMEVRFQGRGIQAVAEGYCDQIVVSSTDSGVSVGPSDPNRQNLRDSDVGGNYSAFAFVFNTASLRVGENAIHVYSGRRGCLVTTGDADDFELTTVTGKLR